MGRELQKKKRRSGLSKVVRKPKSQKQILNNPVIAASWDSKQTLSQNYARLGLTTRLNKQTGGRESFEAGAQPTVNGLAVHPLKPSSKSLHSLGAADDEDRKDTSVHEVCVERDPDTGNILRILDQFDTQATTEGSTRVGKTAAELALAKSGRLPFADSHTEHHAQDDVDDSSDDNEFAGFTDAHASDGFVGNAALASNSTPVVHELTGAALAAQAQPKAKRRQSARERAWSARMIEKHGHDYKAMFRDRSLNVLQLSEGQLKQKMQAFARETAS